MLCILAWSRLRLGSSLHAAARSDSPAGFEYGCTHQAAETHYLMRQAVELEVADAIDRFLAAAAPPRQHLVRANSSENE